jgi:hypothetical protein
MNKGKQVSNSQGLTLDIHIGYQVQEGDNGNTIFGGDDTNPTWQEYLDGFKDEYVPHLLLIRQAIEENNLIGYTGQDADDLYFKFSDGHVWGFTWRGWGDLMQAIVGKKEGYMAYYM